MGKKNTKELKSGKKLIYWGLLLYGVISAVQILVSFFGGAGGDNPVLEEAKADLSGAIFTLLCIVPVFLAVVGFGMEWKKNHVKLDNVISWFLAITILLLNVSAKSILPPEMQGTHLVVALLDILINAGLFLYLIPLSMRLKAKNKTVSTLALCAFLWVTLGVLVFSILPLQGGIFALFKKVMMLGVWGVHIMIALEFKKD